MAKARVKKVKADEWQNRIVESGEMPANQYLAHEMNARRHPGNQREALRGSLNAVGWIAPVIVSVRTGKMLDGHARIEEALTKDENALVPFVKVDVSESEELLILGTFDPITNQATYDKEALDNLLQGISTGEAGLQTLLADLAAKQGLYFDGAGGTGEPADAEPQIDKAAELNKKWQVKTGDLWMIGAHRLLCGDSTKAEDVARVMKGEAVSAIVADPPYGMRLDADFSGMVNNLKMAQEKGLKSGRKYANVIGDDKDFNAQPVIEAFASPRVQFWFGADYYASTLPDAEHSGAWLVWDKRLDESSDKMFGSCFELIWTQPKRKRVILRHKWAGVFGTEKEPQRGRRHPNQKPVVLLSEVVGMTEGIVADPFAGSGTTLVAAQNLNRKCYAIEISPDYCAVILERMQEAFPSLSLERLNG